MSIFDFVTADNIVAYWDTLVQDERPYIGEELFPADKKLGLDLRWIKGAGGLPVVLKASAFGVKAIPRERIGFDKLSAEMPFFKESTYIDEYLRQDLNMVLESGNQAYIDVITNRIFADETNLIRAAAARREMMRMQALTTGAISMVSNGQTYTYDYGVEHQEDVTLGWADPTADIIEDIRLAKEQIQDETGAVLTRAMCTGKVWRQIRANERIKKEIFVLSQGQGAISDARLRQYISDELEMTVAINDKRFVNDDGNTAKFVPDDIFCMFPDGDLGKTWFGTTPEESDLLASATANVAITDLGVAVTTKEEVDPVDVDTKITQITLPSFEQADKVFIYDVNP